MRFISVEEIVVIWVKDGFLEGESLEKEEFLERVYILGIGNKNLWESWEGLVKWVF